MIGVSACVAALFALQPHIEVGKGVVLMEDIPFAEVATAEGGRMVLNMDAAFPSWGGDAPLPAVVYIHGGGWFVGSQHEGADAIQVLAEGGYFAVSIEYRLGGEAPFPAALEDCFEAVRFLRANAGELGIDSTRIGVVGYSSGGHLAALMATGGSGEVRYEDSKGAEVSWAGIIHGPVMPGLLTGQVRKMFRQWVGGEDTGRKVRDASPASWVDTADPPFFLLCGEDDDVVPSAQSESFHSHLQQVGVDSAVQVVPGARHVISDRSAYQELLRSLDEHLGGHAAISER